MSALLTSCSVCVLPANFIVVLSLSLSYLCSKNCVRSYTKLPDKFDLLQICLDKCYSPFVDWTNMTFHIWISMVISIIIILIIIIIHTHYLTCQFIFCLVQIIKDSLPQLFAIWVVKRLEFWFNCISGSPTCAWSFSTEHQALCGNMAQAWTL